MRSTLRAIQSHSSLQLQLIVTGMHLDDRHGKSIDVIRDEGWKIDAVVPWEATAKDLAKNTGEAIARLSTVYRRLKSDVILVVGDRVEAFAAATAGHLSHLPVAHVHGGDRALGQVDDSLRHAITKLAHIHFPATVESAERIVRLGEERKRIFRAGSPGVDGIVSAAMKRAGLFKKFNRIVPANFALIVLHPTVDDEKLERANAEMILDCVRRAGISQTVVVFPNNDPGSKGIIAAWKARQNQITYLLRDVPREMFLGLMREAAVLVGNSSSGIIEAASFGTPVIDIGSSAAGATAERERGDD